MRNKFFILILFANFSYTANSAEEKEIPPTYYRKNINEQCVEYRKVFDPIFNNGYLNLKELENSSFSHASGLINILEDGFIITDNYIKSENKNNNKIYIRLLKKLWNISKEINDKENLSAYAFTFLNQVLSYIISDYKGSIKNKVIGLNELIEITEDIFIKKFEIEQSIIKLKENKFNFIKRPIFIIYAHPNPNIKARGISPERFVEHYSDEKYIYPGYIALYDIHLNNKENGTKKDAHFSMENSVFDMLRHDLDHISEIEAAERESNILSAIRAGYEIKKKLSKEGRYEDERVMESGLFISFHERPSSFPRENILNYSQLFEMAIKRYSDLDKRHLKKRLDGLQDQEEIRTYKTEWRDWEFILKSKEKGTPFLPVISISPGKQRAFPIVKIGNDYDIIKEIGDYKEEMEYIISNKLAPEDVKIKRFQLLIPAVQEGYENFWNRFIFLFNEGKV